LEGNAIKITSTNLTGLEGLCGEFGFTELTGKLSEFRSSTGFKEAEDADARGRIAALEEKTDQHDSAIAVLQDKLKQLSTDFGRLTGEVSTLRSVAAEMRTLSDEVSGLKEQNAAGFHEGVCGTAFDRVSRPAKKKLRLRRNTLRGSCQVFSIRGSFRTVRRSSQSSVSFRFCGGAVAMV
jgi:hypothetical protein